MASKAPRVGDVVRIPVEMDGAGIVERCEGIHLYVRLFALPRKGHSGLSYVRRDSVEVISRANSH
jgi:hypothetical protein